MARGEFIALIAMMFATIAFSTDAMLPGLPEIAAELTPDAPNRAGLIVNMFILGLGFGTFLAGPLSDAFGRKVIVYAGAVLYITGSALAWAAQSLELVLAARVIQGLGAAGPRIVSLAIIRDLFVGREMARIMSIAMMFFMIVPAIAPMLGAGIIALAGWRAIFGAFVVFSIICTAWLSLRLPETLAPENVRPLRWSKMRAAVGEMFANPIVRLSIFVQTVTMTTLFGTLTNVQQIYDQSFGRGDTFHFWFGAVALASGGASLLNAAIVTRFGMRRLVTAALTVQIALSAVMLVLSQAGAPGAFALFVAWQLGLFCMAGFTIGNLNAIAMQPMGHIAGMAASVIGAVATVVSAILAVPIALLFDGTPVPLVGTVLVLATLGSLLMRQMGRIEAEDAKQTA
ncbi:MAG: multidrug effflux MFS transporter [Pseudomonadota bacterium]